jgi:hypothetical protein
LTAKDELVKGGALILMREKLQGELRRLQDQAANFRTLSDVAKEQAIKLSRAAIAEARLLSPPQRQQPTGILCLF